MSKEKYYGNTFINRTGEKHITNEGYEVEIIEYKSNKNCTIQFKDNKVLLKEVCYKEVRDGKIRNPYHPSVHGVGYLGQGVFKTSLNNVKTPYYNAWANMLCRACSEKFKQNNPSYKDVTVCEEWHNFQVFAHWMENNYNFKIMDGWQLDKDILFKGNKKYSSETCCFVPNEINMLFVQSNSTRGEYPVGVNKTPNKKGSFSVQCKTQNSTSYVGTFDTVNEAFQAYKEVKEKYIKEVADRWRDKVPQSIYNALIEYKIEITD